jgi:predicted nuclease of predicted toxin-antitoxin system
MRLLLDEMLAARIAAQLRERRREVVAVSERPELRGLPDDELFERAQEEKLAIVTYNREDFLALDRRYRAAGREHSGIVILHPRRFPQSVRSLNALVESLEALIVAGPPYPGFVHWLK